MVSTMSPCMLSVASAIAAPARRNLDVTGRYPPVILTFGACATVTPARPARAMSSSVMTVQCAAMSSEIQKSNIIHEFGRCNAVTVAYLLDFKVALRKVGHHPHTHSLPLTIDVAQEVARTGVDCVRCEHDGGAALEGALPAVSKIDGISQRSFSNRRFVIPDPFVDVGKINIVDPAGRGNAEPEFGNCGQGHMSVNIHVVHQRRAEQHGFERRDTR